MSYDDNKYADETYTKSQIKVKRGGKLFRYDKIYKSK